ncbi:hypothetical protein VTJ83DRAFT_1419 [Remersonia thermophila]|uniref:Defective in cullin neddylation protein n=1 Tax=Remersonia thermophila TaxID=72144 RepID=A0ABR4DNZ9_9PEZI
MTAPDARDPSRMLSRFLGSCFVRKRRKECAAPGSKGFHAETSDDPDRDGSTNDPVNSAGAAAPFAAPLPAEPPHPAKLPPIRNNNNDSNNSTSHHNHNHKHNHRHHRRFFFHRSNRQPPNPPSSPSIASSSTITTATTTSSSQDPAMPRISKKKPSQPKTNLKVQAARYFADNQGDDGPTQANLKSLKTQLGQLFDELLPESEKGADAIDAEGCQAYIQRLGADPETYEMFVVLETVQAESIGSITRSGFVEGWAKVAAETGGAVAADWSSQQRHIRSRIAAVSSDPNYFKTLYDFAFRVGREPGQKALDMGYALAFWSVLLAPTMNSWRSARVDWLSAWSDFLKEKYGVVRSGGDDDEEVVEYKRTVSRDLWSQTRLFAAKTLQDETLGFWSEDQAWPGMIDEFVVWAKEKGKVPQGDRMEE